MAALNVRDLGDFIRDQRNAAHISLRQLAKQAGVSNPYLSQIERGLRKPSAEILQQIAKALRISAEVLYVQAGILEEREGGENVHAAVLADDLLTARQKQVILDIYDAFLRENTAVGAAGDGLGAAGALAAQVPPVTEPEAPAPAHAEAPEEPTAPKTTRARRAPTAGTAETTVRATTRRPRATPSVDPATTTVTPARRAATTRRATTRRATTTSVVPADPQPETTTEQEPPAAP